MPYPGQRSELYVIGQNKTCLPSKGSPFNKIVVGSVGGDLTLKGAGLLTEFIEDGALCSDVIRPVSSGKLDTNQSILDSSVVSRVDEGSSSVLSGVSSQTEIKVFRYGMDVTSSITTLPSFDGIVVSAEGEVSTIFVNDEGTDLNFGDVIVFEVQQSSLDAGIEITITLSEDDLQLEAGWYAYKSEDAEYTVPVVAGEVVEGSFYSIQTPDETGFSCKAYV